MKKKTFLDTPMCVKTFFNHKETELYIHDLGYHDFQFVRPLTISRTQPSYTIHFVISGKGILNVNNKTYHLKASDIFVLPPDVFFSYYPEKSDPWEYIFFDFNGSMAEEYISSIGFSLNEPVKTCSSPHKTLSAFSEFFEKQKNDVPVSYFEMVSLLFALFDASLNKDSKLLTSSRDNLIEEIKTYIRLNYYDPDLTVESIAAAMHISHSLLCRQFKTATGTTMIAYINEQRMKFAEQLLRTTSLKAMEIAYMSGFHEYTYFLMQFKRKNKMTTSEYRTMLQQKPSSTRSKKKTVKH